MPNIGADKAQIAAVISQELFAEINELAEALGWSRSQLIAELLEDAVRDNRRIILGAVKARRVKRSIQRGYKSLMEIFLLNKEEDSNAATER